MEKIDINFNFCKYCDNNGNPNVKDNCCKCITNGAYFSMPTKFTINNQDILKKILKLSESQKILYELSNH